MIFRGRAPWASTWPSRTLVFAIAFGWLVATADPAAGHGGGSDEGTSSNYRTRITSVVPALPDVTVRVIDTGSRLELTYRGTGMAVVVGYQGEPYLRVGPDGVFENARSPAAYLNRERNAQVDVPDNADPAAPPEWRRVSTDATARWHDHRSHWMSNEPPPAVQSDRDVELVIFDRWVVPVAVDGHPVEIAGDLTWVPPPSRATWWLFTLGLSSLAVVAFRRWRWGWIHVGALVAAAGADLIATIGVVMASVESVFLRASQFLYAALIAVAAIRVTLRTIRGAAGPHLAAALAGLLSFGMSGASRLDGFSNSQIPSVLHPTMDRALTGVSVALGAALLIDFVVGLRRTTREVSP